MPLRKVGTELAELICLITQLGDGRALWILYLPPLLHRQIEGTTISLTVGGGGVSVGAITLELNRRKANRGKVTMMTEMALRL